MVYLPRLATGAARRVWVLARDLKAQEVLSQDIAVWWGPALFFPEAEELRTEDSLPDLEAQAERLALLQGLGFTVEPAAFHQASARPCHRVWIEEKDSILAKSRPALLN